MAQVRNDTNGSYFPIIENFTTLDRGSPIYGNTTTDAWAQIAAPTATGDVLRILGHIYKGNIDERYYIMLFRPSNDWIII